MPHDGNQGTTRADKSSDDVTVRGLSPSLFDLRSLPAAFYDNPFPTYHRLRREAPVLRCADGSVLLTRHADLMRVYRDTKSFSSDKKIQFAPVFGEGSPLFEHHTSSLVFNDPPLHTRVRRAIGDALSVKMVERLAPVVRSLVARLIDDLAGRQRVDLIAEFASAIPVEVIGGMLAIPVAERAPLREWSLAILGALEFAADQRVLERGNAAVTEFVAYLQRRIALRRATLTAADDDIMARLLRASGGADGLTASELVHQCIFLLNAGHETTTNLIGNAIALLAEAPEARACLLSGPEGARAVVEEVLRLESPNQLGNRTATMDVMLGDTAISAGTVLTLCIGAANRDPEVFDAPDAFQPDRGGSGHLAFGYGIHTCAGLAVARLEGQVALSALFGRFPDLRILDARRAHRARFRGFTRLDAVLR